MDWSKAKTILIIAFLITDVFLLLTYGFSGRDKEDFTDAQRGELAAYLEEKNIFLRCEVPEDRRTMSILKVQLETVSEEEVQRLIREQGPLFEGGAGAERNYVKAAEKFLSEAGLFRDTAVLERAGEEEGRQVVRFRNEQDDISIEKSYMTVFFDQNKVTGLEYYWLNPEEEAGKRKQETISAEVALLTFMSKKEGTDPLYVDHIEMVYWLNENSFHATSAVYDTALPAWKIVYDQDKTAYIEAYEHQ